MQSRFVFVGVLCLAVLTSCGRGSPTGGEGSLPAPQVESSPDDSPPNDRDKSLGQSETIELREYRPLDLIEAMKKAALKLKGRNSEGLDKITRLTTWKAPGGRDIGAAVGMLNSDSQLQSSYLFCHYHAELMACHAIQNPGLSGNPELSTDSDSSEKSPLDPIDPF